MSTPSPRDDSQINRIFAEELLGPDCLSESVATNALAYLQSTTSIVQALALSELIFPKLVRYRGGIFLEGHFDPQNVDHWMARTGATLQSVEAMVNHIHLGIDQFLDTPKSHLPLVQDFADRLTSFWPGWVKQTYGWDIEVSIDVTDDDLEITLYTKLSVQSS